MVQQRLNDAFVHTLIADNYDEFFRNIKQSLNIFVVCTFQTTIIPYSC